jgi:ABC-2 type transport system permease protein
MSFTAIFRYEIAAWLKKPAFYLISVVCFLIPLFLFLGTGGFFDGNTVEKNQTLLFLNSPFRITSFLNYIGKFLLFLLPVIIGSTIYKDFQHGMYSFFYSYPIGKGTYLAAKFSSAFFLVCLVSVMPLLAFISGELVLGEGNPYITSTNANGYLFAYGLFLLPNLLVFGLMVFSVVALFRNIYAGFLLVLLLIIFQFIIENVFHQSAFMVALADPFGDAALSSQTRYWTANEKNEFSLSITQILIYNRLLWLGVGICTALITYRKYSLSQFGIEFRPGRDREHQASSGKINVQPEKLIPRQRAGGLNRTLLQLYILIRNQLSYILSHWIFISFTLMGLLLLVFMLNRILHSADLTMLPLTRLILQIPALFYSMLVVFSTFIFSGMLMLREKESGMEPLIYCTHVSTAILISSKALSLILIQLILLFLLMAAGVAIQALSGFYQFDFPQYFSALFMVQAPVLAVWALLAVFVFSISRHLYLGLFILMLAWLAQFGYEQLGITSKLLQFNTYSFLTYSDFNGYGRALAGRLILQMYWLFCGIMLLIAAIWVWPRVQTDSFKQKRAVLKTNSRKCLVSVGILLLPFGFLAHHIYQSESLIFEVDESQKVLSDFKEKFGFTIDIPQPRISSVSLHVELFPERNAFAVQGEYMLVNKTDEPIDTILIKTSMDEITEYRLDIPNRQIDSFPAMNFFVTQLSSPVMPGDSVGLDFTIENRLNTLFQKNSGVLGNGTFLTQDILPRIGYFLGSDEQISDDSNPANNHYQSWDSDLVAYRATLSTRADQLAFTNGSLIEQWQKDGRNYFSYQTPEPVKFNFHFNSGRFEIYRDQWESTPISIYHHPEHTHNLEAIASGVKAAVEFNHRLFGYAPTEGINIIEYPLSESSFSTLKSNSIIMSESVFGVNTEQADNINLPFYVAAHEITHHWFGNKLIPKDAPGALFLIESITEYLTLQIFKERFGDDAALEFLNVQHERYFRGRANAGEVERPLYLVEQGQDYISYGKGAVALNAVAHTLGQEEFHAFLTGFFREHAESDRYPDSYDFLEMLDEITSESSGIIIEEVLMKKVIYDLEIISADILEIEGCSWLLIVEYSIEAFEAGAPLKAVDRRPAELGIYDKKGELIRLMTLFANENTIQIEVHSKPHQLLLDPNYLIPDIERANNSIILN